MNTYIYTSYWDEPNPKWKPALAGSVNTQYVKKFLTKSEVIFTCEAIDIINADKLLFKNFGFKMSDKECIINNQKRLVSLITTWSPNWMNSTL